MTTEKHCNGICLSAYEIGIPIPGIAYAHPDCELHGNPYYDPEDEYPVPEWYAADRIIDFDGIVEG